MENKIYLVVGVMEKHSGSATWPEDFDLVCAYRDEKEAEKHRARLAREALAQEDHDYNIDVMTDEDVYDALYDFDDAPEFDVHCIEVK